MSKPRATPELGRWILPQPEITEKKYISIPKIGNKAPFGYMDDPDDPLLLVPIPAELEALEKARKFINQYSYREVAAWLSTTSGRYISHMGLVKRIEHEQKHKARARTYRKLAERYALYIEKAKEYEEKYRRLTGIEEGGEFDFEAISPFNHTS